MEISYLESFFWGWIPGIMIALILLWWVIKAKFKNDGYKKIDTYLSTLLVLSSFGFFFGVITFLLAHFFVSDVMIVKKGETKTLHYLYNCTIRNKTIEVGRDKRWIYNQSGQDLVIYPVAYGNASTKDIAIVEIKPNTFVEVVYFPSYYFEKAPTWGRYRSGDGNFVRYVLDYKSEYDRTKN